MRHSSNLDDFRRLINERVTLNASRKSEEDIEAAIKFFNDTIQWAGWNATPEHTDTLEAYDCLILSKQNIEEKENSIETGTDYEHPKAKDYLTQQHKNSKQFLYNNKNNCIQTFLQGLTPTKSLWKATEKLKQIKKLLHHLR
jgi:hypothetical protein